MSIESFDNKTPRIDSTAFVHPTAVIIGDVVIQAHCSIWPYAVLRGDVEPIVVGANTNIQDHAMVHSAKGYPVSIGKSVTIGHHAIVHGAIIEDEVIIGMDSVVLDGAIINTHSLVGAKALVTSRTVVPHKSLVLGAPAKVICELSKTQIKSILDNAQEYLELKDKMMEKNDV